MDNTTTQAVAGQLNDDALFTFLTQDLRKIESDIMPQLEELQSKIPEIYSGYANIVRETVSATISMLSTDNNTANKIALGAEIAARGLEAFGQWKAAQKHNELLDKFMRIKQSIANNNYKKSKNFAPKSRKNYQVHTNCLKNIRPKIIHAPHSTRLKSGKYLHLTYAP